MAPRPIVKFALIGYGALAHAFLDLLQRNREILPFSAAIAGIIYKDHGFRGMQGKPLLLEHFMAKTPPLPALRGGIARFIKNIDSDVIVELTPLNAQNGEPAAGYLRTALNYGNHVITANKGAIAFHFPELQKLAQQKKRLLRFGATIGKGLPVFSLQRNAASTTRFLRLRAQLNATTNYVLSRMQEGLPEMQAVAEAQAAGLCEYSPHLDLDGRDGAIQSAILANVFMGELHVDDVVRDHFQRAAEIVKRATRGTGKVRQIVNIENIEAQIRASVRLQVIAEDDAFYHLQAGDFALTMASDLGGETTVTLRTPSIRHSAAALLADLCDVYRNGIRRQHDPELFEEDSL